MPFCRSSAQLFKSTNRPTPGNRMRFTDSKSAKVAVLKRDDDLDERPPTSAIAQTEERARRRDRERRQKIERRRYSNALPFPLSLPHLWAPTVTLAHLPA
ncbi:hypothetical protein MARPO_0005s0016 [Marchantia polymorpha]|uniref:Uncharacterized protein n=1 Tax=Marchantia polymorpha TaxID=3197 RepID=A0A2R6XQF1_MARPO|nr:hypothetical protein MARPO_0005s0016 [Marchantia polymorpha]|eukprot:PTQ48341.1 hypothetical protein MARPO_0005s0016 [Marchantia polymorpha]